LKINDLILDMKGHTVKLGDNEIYLTRKEFSLLAYLMKNKGNVVSRGMIMEHVWDMNADPFSNTIEAHILNLRRKVDISIDRKFIHTIPGRGYKFS
ncbi:MAG: winged helix-turn-helix domain-containing protein, partial [bacterium]